MTNPTRLIALLIVAVLPVVAVAAEKAKPAAESESAVKAALLLYDKLVGPGEADKALPLYYARSTREKALAERFAKLDGAMADLRAAAARKFGRDIADNLARAIGNKSAQDINAAAVSLSGDEAAVLFPGDASPMVMTRVEGEWKVSVRHALKGVDDLPGLRASYDGLTDAVTQVAKDIRSGRYTTAEEPSKTLIDARNKHFGNPEAPTPAADKKK